MKSLKERNDELEGYYDMRWASVRREEIELLNKLSKFINKQAQTNGHIASSSYIYSVYDKIWSGEMTFSQYKKQVKMIS